MSHLVLLDRFGALVIEYVPVAHAADVAQAVHAFQIDEILNYSLRNRPSRRRQLLLCNGYNGCVCACDRHKNGDQQPVRSVHREACSHQLQLLVLLEGVAEGEQSIKVDEAQPIEQQDARLSVTV